MFGTVYHHFLEAFDLRYKFGAYNNTNLRSEKRPTQCTIKYDSSRMTHQMVEAKSIGRVTSAIDLNEQMLFVGDASLSDRVL